MKTALIASAVLLSAFAPAAANAASANGSLSISAANKGLDRSVCDRREITYPDGSGESVEHCTTSADGTR